MFCWSEQAPRRRIAAIASAMISFVPFVVYALAGDPDEEIKDQVQPLNRQSCR